MIPTICGYMSCVVVETLVFSDKYFMVVVCLEGLNISISELFLMHPHPSGS